MKKLQQMRACLARLIAAGGRKLVTSVNAVTNVGIHLGGRCTATCSGAISDANLVMSAGDGLIATNTGIPIGVALSDGVDGQECGFSALGGADRTLRMICSAAITPSVQPIMVADGAFVKPLPAAPGTYYQVGLALTSTLAAGDSVEVAPCSAARTVVT